MSMSSFHFLPPPPLGTELHSPCIIVLQFQKMQCLLLFQADPSYPCQDWAPQPSSLLKHLPLAGLCPLQTTSLLISFPFIKKEVYL